MFASGLGSGNFLLHNISPSFKAAAKPNFACKISKINGLFITIQLRYNVTSCDVATLST